MDRSTLCGAPLMLEPTASMMKRPLVSVAAVALLVGAIIQPAQAIPFTGSVDYAGVHATSPSGFIGDPPRTVTLLGPGGVGNPRIFLVTGNIAGFISVLDTIEHAPITYNPITAPIQPLWIHPSGVVFDLNSFAVAAIDATTMVLKGSGVFRCTGACVGYDDTPGDWNMTLNLAPGQTLGSFSSSSSVSSSSTIPEPGPLGLLVAGLLLLARTVRARR